MEFNLKNVLRALLFSTSDVLSIRDIQDVIMRFQAEEKKPQVIPESDDGTQQTMNTIINQVPALITATQIREALDQMAQEYIDKASVYRVLKDHDGYRLVIAPEYSEWVRALRKEPKPLRLSQSLLETLAIIAYRQPTTRAEMEAIRGVAVDNAINKLLELELVKVLGRADLPGRPMQYGTTDTFLELCGLRELGELPASDVLSPQKISALLNKEDEEHPLSDSDVGLADESEEESSDNTDPENPKN